MRTVVLASVRRHARRYVATGVAVVIAVAFMVAVNALSGAARQGAADEAAAQYRGVDVVVEYPGDVDAAQHVLATDPDVMDVDLDYSGYMPVATKRGPTSVSVGTVSSEDARRWQVLESGALPTGPDEVLVDAGRSDDLRLAVGETFRLGEGTEARVATVAGLVEPSGGQRSAAVYVTPELAAAMPEEMYPDALLGTVADGASPDTVAARIGQRLPELTVSTAADFTEQLRLSVTDGIDVLQRLLLGFAGVALFVGALVIANTFAIVLAQRSRDFALLRCVGAVRRQVVRSVVAEAFVLAVVASLLGVAAGFGVAALVSATAHTWAPTVPLASPSPTLTGVVLPVVLAVLVTVLAAWVPARRVARLSPLAALRPQGAVEVRSRAGVVRIIAGLLFGAVGAAALVVGARGEVVAGLVGGMLSFLGVLALLPVVVPFVIAQVGRLTGRTGVAGRLAVANAGRNPRRTATTSSALLIGVTLVVTVVVGTATVREGVSDEMDLQNPVDVTVLATGGGLVDGVVSQVGRIDGVDAVAALPGVQADVGGVETPVLAVDDAAWSLVRGDQAPPPDGTIRLPYSEVYAVVSEDASGAPATVAVTVGDRTADLRVELADGLGSAGVVSESTFGELAGDVTTRAVWLRAEGGADARALLERVAAVTGDGALEVDGGLAERADVLEQLDVLLLVTVGLLAIAVVIAVVGISNTLGLSVLERLRENALLRALGLPARGLRRMLAAEAALLSFVATVLGLLLGAMYAWFGVQALGAELFSEVPAVVIPWTQVALIGLVALVAGLLASVIPARRAARVAPVASLADA